MNTSLRLKMVVASVHQYTLWGALRGGVWDMSPDRLEASIATRKRLAPLRKGNPS